MDKDIKHGFASSVNRSNRKAEFGSITKIWGMKIREKLINCLCVGDLLMSELFHFVNFLRALMNELTKYKV